ncbi:phosphatidylinositol transporter ASCRUDRAFT_16581, partial [Ascoidea rubescens DSM 1968]
NSQYRTVEIPIEYPLATQVVPPESPLTKVQQLKYLKVLNHLLTLNDTNQFQIDDKSWLTRECILRYLRATKWLPNDAIKRIKSTISWRKEFGISNQFDNQNVVNFDLCSIENQTGKEVILGFDNNLRPCLYLKPGRQNTKASLRQVQHLVLMLEKVIDFMPPGQDSLALLIDFKPYNVLSKEEQSKLPKVPSISIGKQVLHILQNHYPERLGKALLTNMPWYAKTFLNLIHPFIDPLTKTKLVYNEPFVNYVPTELLDKDFGGEINFIYKHEVYWKNLVEISNKKRLNYINRFNRFGRFIGLSEFDLRGEHNILKYP